MEVPKNVDHKQKIINNDYLKKKLFFILNGKNRIKIYRGLLSGYKTARDLEKNTNITLSSVCRSLKELKERGIIECLNEYQIRGKYYRLTSEAIQLRSHIVERSKIKNSSK